MKFYSYSKIRCYEQCPLKYKLRYINKIKPKTEESIELFLGKKVHEVLKRLYSNVMYNKENTLSDLIHFLHHQWETKWDHSIVTVQKKHRWKEFIDMAEQYIVDYYHHYYPFNTARTIAVEKYITVNLNDSADYKLCGYIDRVSKTDDGYYQIHDYKTCSRLPSKQYFQEDKQLALYALCIKKKYPYIKNMLLI